MRNSEEIWRHVDAHQDDFIALSDRVWEMPELCYAERKQRLLEETIAVWDVCASAYRPGSLDAAIRNYVPNEFAEFFKTHPHIDLICFNGATAEKIYRRCVLAEPPIADCNFRYQKLPSTSPAYSALTFEEKFAAWSAISRNREPQQLSLRH